IILAHIVSCLGCLDEVNNLLGLPPLAERYPTDMIGPDNRSHGGGSAGGSGAGNGGGRPPTNSLNRRARETFEHSPKQLSISVNGFILGSQKIGSQVSEQTVNFSAAEKIGFVEVLSEQGIRLALLNVVPPPDGAVLQATSVALSEE